MPQGSAQPASDAASGFRGWLARQRGRLALWAPVAVGAGALVYFLLKHEPEPAWGLGAGALGAMALVGSGGLSRGGWVAAATGLAAIGFALAMLRAALVGTPVLPEPATVTLTGQAVEAYGHQDGRPRVVIDVAEAEPLSEAETPRRVRLALRKGDERPLPGTWLRLRARLTPLPTPVAPGGYDFARGAWFDGIGAYGFVSGAPEAIAEVEAPGLLDRAAVWIAEVRHDASQRIHAALPGSTGAIAAALTVGDRSEIAEADDEAMRDSSLAHVLSISGLHMAIVGLGILGTLRFIGALVPAVALRFQVKKWAALAALLGSAAYLALSGASVPAQRSFIMIGLMFVAIIADRAPFTLRIVAISALIVLAVAPESIVDPSFQMSFAAVTALVAAFEAFEAWQVRRGAPLVMRDTWSGRIGYALAIALISSLVAGLATAPYAAFHFNRVAAYGVIANLIAMPIIAFMIMPAAAITLLALPFGLEAYPLAAMGWGIDAMLWIAHQTTALPGAASHVASSPDLALGLMTLGGLWLCLFRERWRLAGLVPIAAAMILAALTPQPDILIDRDARNIAVRDADGRLALLSGRRARFAGAEWLDRDGDAGEVKDAARRGREGVWRCEDGLCGADMPGLSVGYMERSGDGRRACAAGFDILVTARDIDPCTDGLTFGPAALRHQGATAIYLQGSDIRIVTVRDGIGDRPWIVWGAEAGQ